MFLFCCCYQCSLRNYQVKFQPQQIFQHLLVQGAQYCKKAAAFLNEAFFRFPLNYLGILETRLWLNSLIIFQYLFIFLYLGLVSFTISEHLQYLDWFCLFSGFVKSILVRVTFSFTEWQSVHFVHLVHFIEPVLHPISA